ncbi:vWA domain-containing protein [Muribaculum intestinale]|uniref:vWA domain-containing protein n=1 Tax=Muribaculum intestinale TaxID=1796646 RepID=UPI0033B1815E
MMQLAHPGLLWLFLLYIPLIAWYIMRHRDAYPSMGMSTVSWMAKAGRPLRQYGLYFLFVLRLLALGCIIIVLARPQSSDAWSTSKTEGTDMIIALDISSSMLARDFKPDRLEAAKKIASRFINGRENDNMGLVVFAGEAFTGVPMTTDRATLMNYVQSLNREMLEDGTAIGDGLATAINRIKSGQAKSKSIILLTDGSNNTGIVSPLMAAEIAHKEGIKVYTIGIGTNGTAPYPQINMFGRMEFVPQPVVIDEGTLKQISDITGGKYFRATGNKVLADIFAEIDRLETSEIDVRHFSHTEDIYFPWAMAALGLLLLDLLLRNTWLRTMP